MNSPKAVGGFFELDLDRESGGAFYTDAIALNSARNSFEYILRVRQPAKVYLSKYTCDVMLEPLEKTGIPYEFYRLNDKLEMADDVHVSENELLVYVNYFGIKDRYSRDIATICGDRAVIDASQAFYYAQHANEHVIYSPRKFFGVPDGGYLVTDRQLNEEIPDDVSYTRMSHLLKRVDMGPEQAYDDFKHNDASLEMQPIKGMSNLTRSLLESAPYEKAKIARRHNYGTLHAAIGSMNELNCLLGSDSVPLIYPFMTKDAEKIRKQLIERRIFSATYWPNVFTWCDESELEYALARDIVTLPIDQRYDERDMNTILEVLYEYYN